MGKKEVFQFGEKPIYIERNEGNVYVGDYVSKTNEALLMSLLSYISLLLK